MRRSLILSAAALGLGAGAAAAEEHVVEMLNEGPDGAKMVYEPPVVHADPGDTVRFVPVDRGHNATTLRNGAPEGADSLRGGIGEEVTYTVSEDGIHVIMCTPHYGVGMIALVVVGDDTSNADAVRDAIRPRRAEERFDDYLAQARTPAAG